MIMDGCQGKPRTPTIEDRICPNCGNPIEIFFHRHGGRLR